MQHLSLDTVVVPDTLNSRIEGFTGLKVDADRVSVGLLLLDKDIMNR